jgi:Protein kinase domain
VTPEAELVAEALPAYDIMGELGRGGWGIVLEGRHRHLGRPVAIKQLPLAFGSDPDVRSRFLAEARLLASLDHPHIVPVYDFVERDGLCVLVMEKLPGGTVWTRFSKEGMTHEAACGIGVVASVALEHAHRQGILHRDVKPENLMFSAKGVMKVTDFGIAKVLSGGRTMATRTGDVLGTPSYMAPEQAMGRDVGPETDVYALGVMIYELLSGRLPFSADSAMAVLFKHVHEAPVPLGSDVPAAVAEVVMRALEKDPADRHASAEEFGMSLASAAAASFGAGWLPLSLMAGGKVAAVAGDVGPARPEAVTVRPTPAPAPVVESTRVVDVAPEDLVPVAEAAHLERERALLPQVRTVFPEKDWVEVERLLGGDGPDPAARLGVSPTVSAEVLRLAAVDGHQKWQRRAESPLATRDQREAARVVVRTLEGILHQLSSR